MVAALPPLNNSTYCLLLQGALVDFENVSSLEPRNYVGDNLARFTPILPVTHYNIACCYSMLGQVSAEQQQQLSLMFTGGITSSDGAQWGW